MFRVAPARLLIATAIGCLLLALPLHASDFDRTAFMAINDAAWRWGPPALFSCLTILGHGLSAVMLLAPTLLRAPNLLMAGLFATPVAMALSWLPKGLIDSPRPAAVLDPASIHVVGLQLAGHNSFPSGHAITAFLVVGVLLAGERATRPRWPAALAIATGRIADRGRCALAVGRSGRDGTRAPGRRGGHPDVAALAPRFATRGAGAAGAGRAGLRGHTGLDRHRLSAGVAATARVGGRRRGRGGDRAVAQLGGPGPRGPHRRMNDSTAPDQRLQFAVLIAAALLLV